MKRRPRVCCICNKPLSSARPVFLIEDTDGSIRGPLHAECAKATSGPRERAWEQIKRFSTRYGTVLARQPGLAEADEQSKWGLGGTEW